LEQERKLVLELSRKRLKIQRLLVSECWNSSNNSSKRLKIKTFAESSNQTTLFGLISSFEDFEEQGFLLR